MVKYIQFKRYFLIFLRKHTSCSNIPAVISTFYIREDRKWCEKGEQDWAYCLAVAITMTQQSTIKFVSISHAVTNGISKARLIVISVDLLLAHWVKAAVHEWMREMRPSIWKRSILRTSDPEQERLRVKGPDLNSPTACAHLAAQISDVPGCTDKFLLSYKKTLNMQRPIWEFSFYWA